MRRNPQSYTDDMSARQDMLTANYWLRQPSSSDVSQHSKLERSFSIAGLKDKYLLAKNEDPVHKLAENTSVANFNSSQSFNFCTDPQNDKPVSRSHSGWLKFLFVLTVTCPLAAFFTFWIFKAEKSLNIKVRKYLLTAAWMLTLQSVLIWAGVMAVCLIWFLGDSAIIGIRL